MATEMNILTGCLTRIPAVKAADQGSDHGIMYLCSNRTSPGELRAQHVYEDSPYTIDVVMWLTLEVM